MTRKFKKLNDNATLPERETTGSAGYDIASSETVTIQPGIIELIHTGLAVQMEKDDVLLLVDRSSNPRKRGIVLSNSVGVIDHDYFPNEFMGQFTNITDKPITIEKGQRIMQAVFMNYGLTEDDHATGERTGGFGSTDVKKVNSKKDKAYSEIMWKIWAWLLVIMIFPVLFSINTALIKNEIPFTVKAVLFLIVLVAGSVPLLPLAKYIRKPKKPNITIKKIFKILGLVGSIGLLVIVIVGAVTIFKESSLTLTPSMKIFSLMLSILLILPVVSGLIWAIKIEKKEKLNK